MCEVGDASVHKQHTAINATAPAITSRVVCWWITHLLDFRVMTSKQTSSNDYRRRKEGLFATSTRPLRWQIREAGERGLGSSAGGCAPPRHLTNSCRSTVHPAVLSHSAIHPVTRGVLSRFPVPPLVCVLAMVPFA